MVKRRIKGIEKFKQAEHPSVTKEREKAAEKVKSKGIVEKIKKGETLSRSEYKILKKSGLELKTKEISFRFGGGKKMGLKEPTAKEVVQKKSIAAPKRKVITQLSETTKKSIIQPNQGTLVPPQHLKPQVDGAGVCAKMPPVFERE